MSLLTNLMTLLFTLVIGIVILNVISPENAVFELDDIVSELLKTTDTIVSIVSNNLDLV